MEERGLPFLPPPDLFFWLVKMSLRMDGCVCVWGRREDKVEFGRRQAANKGLEFGKYFKVLGIL